MEKSQRYYVDQYDRVYENFCFNLGVYGSRLNQRRILKEALILCTTLHKKHSFIGVSTGGVCSRMQAKIYRRYVNYTNDDFMKGKQIAFYERNIWRGFV